VFLSTLSAAAGGKQKVVFLGTPEVAAQSLRALIAASKTLDAPFEISAVISNPPAKQGRKKQLQSSPVHLAGEEAGIPVLTPAGLLKKNEGKPHALPTPASPTILPTLRRFVSSATLPLLTLALHPPQAPQSSWSS
jgi:methionyl-tRNA formyltransferase